VIESFKACLEDSSYTTTGVVARHISSYATCMKTRSLSCHYTISSAVVSVLRPRSYHPPLSTQYLLPSLKTSLYSSNGLLPNLVSFHRFGVKNPYVFATATNVALSVFSSVFVDPAEAVYASITPASCSRRFTAGEATRPVPRGAGMSYRGEHDQSYNFFCFAPVVYVAVNLLGP